MKEKKEPDATTQMLETVAATVNQSNAGIAKAMTTIVAATAPYQNLFNTCSGVVAEEILGNKIAHVIPQEYNVSALTGVLSTLETNINSSQNIVLLNSYLLAMLNAVNKTPELLDFQMQLENNISRRDFDLSVVSDYLSGLTCQWNGALYITDVAKRSIAAQNIAVIRMIPKYAKLDLPRGSKKVLKSLTKTTAKKLAQTEDIRFDPKEIFIIKIHQRKN